MNAIHKASKLRSTFSNEHNQILFETEQGIRYKVIQIAGYVARKIVSYVRPGETVTK
jgi:phosphatidylserine decarboxylase